MTKNHADTTRAHLRDTETLADTDGVPFLDADGAPVTVDGEYTVADDDLTDLERVERQHGFIFGVPSDHDTAGAQVTDHVACPNPDCPQVNRLVALHADTEGPVMCGGCGWVLKCDHVWEQVETVAGTLAQPMKLRHEHCTRCGTDTPDEQIPLDPINLADLPLDVVAGILNTPADQVPQYTNTQTH